MPVADRRKRAPPVSTHTRTRARFNPAVTRFCFSKPVSIHNFDARGRDATREPLSAQLAPFPIYVLEVSQSVFA